MLGPSGTWKSYGRPTFLTLCYKSRFLYKGRSPACSFLRKMIKPSTPNPVITDRNTQGQDIYGQRKKYYGQLLHYSLFECKNRILLPWFDPVCSVKSSLRFTIRDQEASSNFCFHSAQRLSCAILLMPLGKTSMENKRFLSGIARIT